MPRGSDRDTGLRSLSRAVWLLSCGPPLRLPTSVLPTGRGGAAASDPQFVSVDFYFCQWVRFTKIPSFKKKKWNVTLVACVCVYVRVWGTKLHGDEAEGAHTHTFIHKCPDSILTNKNLYEPKNGKENIRFFANDPFGFLTKGQRDKENDRGDWNKCVLICLSDSLARSLLSFSFSFFFLSLSLLSCILFFSHPLHASPQKMLERQEISFEARQLENWFCGITGSTCHIKIHMSKKIHYFSNRVLSGFIYTDVLVDNVKINKSFKIKKRFLCVRTVLNTVFLGGP